MDMELHLLQEELDQIQREYEAEEANLILLEAEYRITLLNEQMLDQILNELIAALQLE
jgi:hypothetical protein